MSQQVSNYFVDYFDNAALYLKLFGVWYDEKENKNVRTNRLLYMCFMATYVLIIYFTSEILPLFWSYPDTNAIIQQLRDIGNHACGNFKFVVFLYHRKELFNIMNSLTNGHFTYESCNDFDPRKIVKKERMVRDRWKYFFLFTVNGILILFLLSTLYPFVFDYEQQYAQKNGQLVYAQPLPINIAHPFGRRTRLQFMLSFTYLMFANIYYGWIIVALNNFFITFMSCISAHLSVLSGAVETIGPRCLLKHVHVPSRRHLRDEIDYQMEKELLKCNKHLQFLVKVAKDLENIYTRQIFFQAVESLAQLCLSLFMLIKKSSSTNLFTELFYMATVSMDLMFFCRFGDKLTESSSKLTNGFYNSDWVTASKTFKKSIIFSLMRLNQPVYLSIGKFSPLSLRTFLSVAKASYSIFALLRQTEK